MEFHNFRLAVDSAKKLYPHLRKMPYDEFYDRTAQITHSSASMDTHEAASSHNQGLFEWRWLDLHGPHYNIWPDIVHHLLNLNLDKVPSDQIELPAVLRCNLEPRVLMFRFAKGANSIAFDDENGTTHELRAILAEWHSKEGQIDPTFFPFQKLERQVNCLTIYMDWGENGKEGMPLYSYQKIPLLLTLQEAFITIPRFASSNIGLIVPQEKQADALKIVAMCCLMAHDDEELITPDVLAKDRNRFRETGDQKFVLKAHRRKKYGWDVGRKVHAEMSPHYRNCHPCIVWYGPGKTKCKLIIRKGSWVRKDRLDQMPKK